MSYSLDQFRTNVRAHLDVDIEDIPDALMDQWCREATTYIARSRERWPFLENYWLMGWTVGVSVYPFSTWLTDPDVDEISSIIPVGLQPLTWVDIGEYETLTVSPSSNAPSVYTIHQSNIKVYPTPAAAGYVAVRGYRQVRDWVSGGAGAFSDLPADFDDVIRNRLLGEAYAQQEDPELGQLYFSKAESLLQTIARRLGTMPQQQPLVMSGRASSRQPLGRIPYSFEV